MRIFVEAFSSGSWSRLFWLACPQLPSSHILSLSLFFAPLLPPSLWFSFFPELPKVLNYGIGLKPFGISN